MSPCSNCGGPLNVASRFCTNCGAQQVIVATTGRQHRFTPEYRGCGFYLGIATAGLLVLFALGYFIHALSRSSVTGGTSETRQKVPPPKPLSPAEQKAAAGVVKRQADAKQQSQLKQVIRIMTAQTLENDFLKHGLEVKCYSNEEKKELMLVGPTINRAFVQQFESVHKFNNQLRKAGFRSVSFWNGNQVVGIFTEDYSLDPRIRN
jgi:hypothetical protein